MPVKGDDRGAGDVIDVVSRPIIDNGKDNGNDNGYDNGHGINKENGLMANENLTSRLQKIKNIPEKNISFEDLIMTLANSGNEKQIKLASDLINMNMTQGKVSENLGPDCFDKISACNDNLSYSLTIPERKILMIMIMRLRKQIWSGLR